MEETKEIKINAPEGYEIDKEKSTFEKIVFKKTENKFSKNWEEFCEKNPMGVTECYISDGSAIVPSAARGVRYSHADRNFIPNKFAEPMLALMQLLTIREKEYTNGWEPDWTTADTKYCIGVDKNSINKCEYLSTHLVLSFPTKDLCDEFYKNWKELIEIAKPLL